MESDAQATGDPMLLWQSAEHCELANQTSDARRVLTELGNYLMRIGTPTDASRAYERALGYCDSWEQRLDLTESLLQAQRASRDWAAIVRTVEHRRQLQTTRYASLAREPAVELMALEARARLSADMRSELTLVLKHLATSSHDRGGQSAFVLMGLIMADNLLDSDAASSLMTFLPEDNPLQGNDDLLLCANLVFHTTFGGLDLAVDCARTIQARYRSVTVPDVRAIQRLRWSAMPLLYAGHINDCERVLALAVSEARRTFLWTEAASAAGLLAEVALSQSDVTLASHRLEDARSYAYRTKDEELLADMRGYAAAIALLSGDLRGARFHLADSGAHNSPRPERRVRARALSLNLAVNYVDGRAPDATLDELVALVTGATEYGDFDFIVCVLLRFLAQRLDAPARTQLLAQYQRRRRERYQMPAVFLRTFCPELLC
jgi:hypothetical protein